MDDLRNLHDDHVFQRSEALESGYIDKDLYRAMRDGRIVRIRQGAYTFTDVWGGADDTRRHLLRAHAVLRSHDTPLVLSHTSAAVEHGLRTFRPDLEKVHVTCLAGALARTTHDVVYHRGEIADDELMAVGPHLVVAPVRAALEAASLADVPAGVVVLDSVLDLGMGSLEEIYEGFARMTRQPGFRKLQISVRLTRKGANSVGESLGRHMMWREHIPEPVLQFEVRDEWGNLLGISDYAWPEYGLLGEFDGMMKYGRLLKDGETPGDAVTREKNREDALREATGWLMIRLIWADLFRPGPTAARLRTQLERGRSLLIA
jgi:hypothetical protein